MKRLLIILGVILLVSCSFDNKTGIWNDASNTFPQDNSSGSIQSDNSNQRYEEIFIKDKIYDEEKIGSIPVNVSIEQPIRVSNWFEQYAVPTNNISNFYYANKDIIISKSPKLSKFSDNKNYSNRSILFYENKLVSYDHKGTIFIYDLDLNKKVFEYNFYKKKFKKFDKEIFLLVDNNILYAADNLGYLYAIDLKNRSFLWAKNYGIPFRSNIKFANNQLFLANQDNVIYSINIKNGDKNWQFATSQTNLKSNFYNNFALDEFNNNLIFLNTSGELYSINYLDQKINWVINFKNPSLVGDTTLFFSKPIIIKNNNILVSTEKVIFNYDNLNAIKNWSFSIKSNLKPVSTPNHVFIFAKNDLLICLDLNSGNVIWSKNIYNDIENKKISKKVGKFYDMKIVNGNINLYSNEGYLLSYKFENGNLVNFKKLSKSGINSKIYFINESMFLIDKNNKLLRYN
jgi:outer membrane protein assembly factor BamB